MVTSEPASVVAIKNVLVATDFSSSSEAALEYAAILARQQQAKVLLAHVLYSGPVFPFEEVPPQGFADVDSARLKMQAAMAAPRFSDIAYELLFPHGDVCSVLEKIVDGRRIDLLVVGTHGRRGVAKLLVGSVAEEVFRCAPCPVLVVGPQVQAGPRPGLRHIVVATDFTPACDRALCLARQLGRAEKALLTVLHVSAAPRVGQQAAEAAARLRAAAPDAVESIVEAGDAAEIIIRVARQRQADLIAMGLHRRSAFWAAHIRGTTAHNVITHASCPVLAVKCS